MKVPKPGSSSSAPQPHKMGASGRAEVEKARPGSLVHPAVVLGLAPTGLSVVRSLAPRGIPVYGVDSIRWEIGHYSRWVRHDHRISYLPPGQGLLRGLIEHAKGLPCKPVIFNTSDAYIDFVAEQRAQLEHYFMLSESMRPEVNSMLINKRTFYQRCESLRIDVPRTFFPNTDEEAAVSAHEIRYPAIVKPVHSQAVRRHLRGRKLVEVQESAELLRWWRRLKSWGSDSVLQEVVVGPESNLVVAGLYMSRDRECLSAFTATKNRQYPPMYGSGSYMESKWLPEIAELSIRIVKELNYDGVCGTEFKWDPRDRKWKLIELNCRPTLWFALTRASGVDVVWDAYCDLVGQPNPPHIGIQVDGVRWQLLVRDLVSACHFLRRGELTVRDILRTVLSFRNKEEAIFSCSDWGASLGCVPNTLMHFWSHFIRHG